MMFEGENLLVSQADSVNIRPFTTSYISFAAHEIDDNYL